MNLEHSFCSYLIGDNRRLRVRVRVPPVLIASEISAGSDRRLGRTIGIPNQNITGFRVYEIT